MTMVEQELLDDIDGAEVSRSCVIDNPDMCHLYISKTANNLVVVHQNIRSIAKNLDNFTLLLHRIRCQVDLIILTECWIDDTFRKMHLPSYDCHFSKIYLNKSDGIVVFAKQGLNITIKEPSFPDCNCLIMDIGDNTTIIALYRSPSIKNIDNFLSALEQITTLLPKNKCIITGDINIDICNDSSDARKDKYLACITELGYHPAHILPTRYDRCLDHVLINHKVTSTVVVCRAGITDHDTVLFTVDRCNIPNNNSNNRKYRTNIRYDALLEDLKCVDWNSIKDETDINTATNHFIETMNHLIDKHTETYRIPNSKFTIKPWMTENMFRAIRRRDMFHQVARKNPNDENIQQAYKDYRNKCNESIKALKIKYKRQQIKISEGDSKKTWKTIKNICQLHNPCSNASELLQTTDTPKKSLNLLNDFFTTIGESLSEEILTKLNTTEEILAAEIPDKFKTSSNFIMTMTDEMEINKIIDGMKTNSAPGVDAISNSIIKKAKHILSPIICHLCNLSLSKGIVPDCMKTANVCPIYKTGDKKQFGNYRPISLLPSISKIFEKVVKKRLIIYLDNEHLLADNQFGFRSARSTEDAIVSLVGNITHNLDKKNHCIGIFLDLAKAFDTVSKLILLRKLELMGIRGIALKWFSSYLSDRKQRVKLDEHHSEYSKIEFGVPQGSVLGPVLFLIYINDLCQLSLPNCHLLAFADDTALIFHGESWAITKKSAEIGLRSVSDWLNRNLLTLNINKTKCMGFIMSSRSAPKSPLNIKIHSCHDTNNHCNCPILEEVKFIKYLGIFIDDHLNWKKQTAHIALRLRKLNYVFNRIGEIGNERTSRLVYFALCQSIINYGLVAWGVAHKTTLLQAEIAQRGIIKTVFRKPRRFSTDSLYAETRLLSVRQLAILNFVLRFHKQAMDDMRINSGRRQRFKKWTLPSTSFFASQRSFGYLGPLLYTKINKKFNLLVKTRNECKRVIKKWLCEVTYNDTEKLFNDYYFVPP